MAKAPTFKSLAKAAEAGYHGKTVNIEGKGLQKVAFADKEYDKRMAKRSAKSPTTDPVVDRARAAIDRAEGEKPYAMRPVARPKRDMSQEPTATKVETPKVTTTQIPPGEGAARTAIEYDRRRRAEKSGGASSRGPAGSPRGPAKGTLENVSGRSRGGFTFDQWREMTRKERKDAGLPTSITGAQFYFRASKASGMAKGGMVKSGYAKGGMIKANCGASMKPTQKGTKK
jgi:hypothetical protein